MKKEPYDQMRLTEFALKMAGDIGATIAVPVSTLTFLAKKAEAFLEVKKPGMIAVAILVSFVFSTVSVSRKAVKYGDRYVKITQEEDGVAEGGPEPPKTV